MVMSDIETVIKEAEEIIGYAFDEFESAKKEHDERKRVRLVKKVILHWSKSLTLCS
jgi:hypothetical protein